MTARAGIKGSCSGVPLHWIGVQADWQTRCANPAEHLISLPPSQLRTHALLLGSTGSGKTNLLHHLIAQDVLCGHSFCVLDLRGDLVLGALELCAGRVDPRRIKLLDLREKERPLGFNPLYGAGEPYFRALNVLDAVASEAESWGVQLSETLRNALLLLAEAGENLASLERVFYTPPFLHRCLARCSAEDVVGFWLRFAALSQEKRSALAMPVLNKVSLLLATSTLRKVLGHPAPLDLGTHLQQPGSITLVSLAVDELHSAGKMVGRLVLSSICREMFSKVATPEAKRNPVRLYVDEFEHFGTEEFETILAEGRRFGLSLVLAHQTLAQLGSRMRSVVLNNVGTKVIFRCGREDSLALCKDIYGDSKAFDLPSLPVGGALLWRNGFGPIEIEINEPIVRGTGVQAERARAFAKHLTAMNPMFQSSDSALAMPTPTFCGPHGSPPALQRAHVASLPPSSRKGRQSSEQQPVVLTAERSDVPLKGLPRDAPTALEDWICS